MQVNPEGKSSQASISLFREEALVHKLGYEVEITLGPKPQKDGEWKTYTEL